MLTMRKVYAMLVGLIVLNGMDVLTTDIGLRLGLGELNPFMPQQTPMAKMLTVCLYAVLWLVCWKQCVREKWRFGLRFNLYALMLQVSFYAGLVVNNLIHIIIMLGR